MDITVVVPSIPARADLLQRALGSIERQTLAPVDVIVELDHERLGAPETRQRGLERVETPWVAFLDDDDEFKPNHLERLAAAAEAESADYVYSWYDVVGGMDPRFNEFGLAWDPRHPRQTTIVTLVRTDLAKEVGGFTEPGEDLYAPGRICSGEDWRFTLRVNDAGGRIFHLPERTWLWYHHGGNTSGLPGSPRR